MKKLLVIAASALALILALWATLHAVESSQQETARKAHNDLLLSIATSVVVLADRGTSVSELKAKVNELEIHQRVHSNSFNAQVHGTIERMQKYLQVVAYFNQRTPLSHLVAKPGEIIMTPRDVKLMEEVGIMNPELTDARLFNRNRPIAAGLQLIKWEAETLLQVNVSR